MKNNTQLFFHFSKMYQRRYKTTFLVDEPLTRHHFHYYVSPRVLVGLEKKQCPQCRKEIDMSFVKKKRV